jgi:hypothetical protein
MLRPARILRAALGVRVARSLYGRWLRLPAPDRERLEPLAEDAKRLALDLRGFVDRGTAERELRVANESLAAALVESAEADPEVTEAEVGRLRDELGRELARLAAAEAGRAPAPPGG